MTTLKVRSIDFRFTDDIPLEWNGRNPGWANAFHYLSFMAPGFERYFVRAIGAAIPSITDAAVAENARLFCRQEGLHARHHAAHVRMLARKHPGLEEVAADVSALYDRLFEDEALEFHLAYAAVVEGTFSPLTKFIVENRSYVFDAPDPRMASFFMWHMVEEYEHRSSAHEIYEAVVGDYRFKLRSTPRIVRHLAEAAEIVKRGFDRHIPVQPGGRAASDTTDFLRRVPWRNRISCALELASTLLPRHDPDAIEAPPWVREWFAAEARGVDMRTYYPSLAP